MLMLAVQVLQAKAVSVCGQPGVQWTSVLSMQGQWLLWSQSPQPSARTHMARVWRRNCEYFLDTRHAHDKWQLSCKWCGINFLSRQFGRKYVLLLFRGHSFSGQVANVIYPETWFRVVSYRELWVIFYHREKLGNERKISIFWDFPGIFV